MDLRYLSMHGWHRFCTVLHAVNQKPRARNFDTDLGVSLPCIPYANTTTSIFVSIDSATLAVGFIVLICAELAPSAFHIDLQTLVKKWSKHPALRAVGAIFAECERFSCGRADDVWA